jgi:aspartate kinase
VLAYGELMSTVLMEAALQASEINARWMDARNMIVTSADFSRAIPIKEKTAVRIRKAVYPVSKSGYVPVLQGFIGSTEDGRTTTLGFEGSDYTAALLGAALECAEIQIWKMVPGIMTADPRVVRNAGVVKQVTFEEAAELSFYGAKVLHPSTIEPAREKRIPINIYDVRNTVNPVVDRTGTEMQGTAIVPEETTQRSVKSVTSKCPLTKIVLQFGPDRTIHKDLPEIYKVWDTLGVPIVLSMYKREMIAAFPHEAVPDDLSLKLQRYGRVAFFTDKASLTLVGNLGTDKSTLIEQAETALGDIPCEAVSDIMSPYSMTFLLDGKAAGEAVKRVHDSFFHQI